MRTLLSIIFVVVYLGMVSAGIGGTPQGDDDQSTTKPDSRSDEKSDPYSLDTCPISGEKLDSMGDSIVKNIDGREVRFCCDACIGRFESNKKKYFKQIDKKLIEQQLPYYPMNTCVVMGDSLIEDGEDIAINYVYRNRLVRFCCKNCIDEFNKNPAKYLAKLDKAVIAQQRETYPLETCVVAGGKLGSMGEPKEIIVGNRLVRFCCIECTKKFDKNPSKYLKMLDEAWVPVMKKTEG